MIYPKGQEPHLLDAGRIPFQRAGTLYRDLSAYDLARGAIAGLVGRHPLAADAIGSIHLGTVIQDVNTSNLAREAALGAGLPPSIPADTVSMACISSNKALTMACDDLFLGKTELALAAGAETMSDIPIRLSRPLRKALLATRGAKSLWQTLKGFRGLRPRDLAPDVPSISEFSTGETMGQSADRMAARYGVGREEQDRFALESHRNAATAHQQGYVEGDLLAMSIGRDAKPVRDENGIRAESSPESLSRLRPVFERRFGTITAGNASFLSDGASAALVCTPAHAARQTGEGGTSLARIRGYRFTAKEPSLDLLMGPALAIPLLLADLGLTMQDLDVIEIHEAFAAQVLSLFTALDSQLFFNRHLDGMQRCGAPDRDKVNRWGGSLAIGHPFGATGIRIVSTAARRLAAENGSLALVASCAAGGQAHAMILERC